MGMLQDLVSEQFPDPPILAFFDFLAFFVFRFSLLFLAFFLLFPRILGVPRREKPLLFWGKTLAFFKKARVGGSGLAAQKSANASPQKSAKGRKRVSSKTKGPGEEGAAGYCPKILLPKRAKVVLCSFHRSLLGKSALEIGHFLRQNFC